MYFDHNKKGTPPAHASLADVRREDLVNAIERVARRRGSTTLRMVTYRLDPASTVLEHRFFRQTKFADGRTEVKTYIISHETWMEWLDSIAEHAVSQTHTVPLFLVWQGLDKLRRRANFQSYFAVLGYLIISAQHGSSTKNFVEPRVFKYLQSMRADLLGCDPWDTMFEPANIAIDDETTTIEIEGCLAGGNRLTRHVSRGDEFTLLDDAGCGDGFTALTRPPVTIRGCKCTGAYCQTCLEKWIKGERPTCPECRNPLLLSTELKWVRDRNYVFVL